MSADAAYHTTWELGYHPPRHILIIYYSRFWVIDRLAPLIAEGAIRVDGVETRFLKVEERPIEEVRPGETEDEVINSQLAITTLESLPLRRWGAVLRVYSDLTRFAFMTRRSSVRNVGGGCNNLGHSSG